MTPHSEKSAVVIGGGMAGLVTAHVLSDLFGRVTLVERDELPAEPVRRKGVPQARHIHILLCRGSVELEQLFPGLIDELVTGGAQRFAPETTSHMTHYGRLDWQGSRARTVMCSRAFLEWHVRRRVMTRGRVAVRDGCVVEELVSDGAGGVSGVRVSRAGAPAETLQADLVVDASGAGSRTPQWLGELGYDAPEETASGTGGGYATRWYRVPEGVELPYTTMASLPHFPDNPCIGAITRIEDRCAVVSLGRMLESLPPTDEQGFLEFARGLEDRRLHGLLQQLEPISPIYAYRKTGSRMRHYGKLARWPERYVVLGDAVCAYNPFYGQGMTMAVLGARKLGECLRPHGYTRGLGRRFQKLLERTLFVPWVAATSEDARWAAGEDAHKLLVRCAHWYTAHLLRRVASDARAGRAYIEVTHLLRSPAAMLAPRIAGPILWSAVRGR